MDFFFGCCTTDVFVAVFQLGIFITLLYPQFVLLNYVINEKWPFELQGQAKKTLRIVVKQIRQLGIERGPRKERKVSLLL